MQEQSNHTPNLAAIRADLVFMTRRWHELPEPAMIEVRAFDEHGTPQIGRFKPDWIDGDVGAVQWIADMNKRGRNCYAVRNPVRDTVAGKGANDTDILAAFYLWADCDEGNAAKNVLRFPGPKWVAAVTTGKIPSTRVHTYWELKEPCTDLAAWRDMQSAIARHFGSDPSVINPSRIMRIGGTISWPSVKKRGKGYVEELTTIRTEYPEPREPVTMDQMARAFASSATDAAPLQQKTATASALFQIDTGNSSPTSASEVRELLSYITPDCGYQDWLSVLMGLHDKFSGSDLGLSIADEWSARGTKYVAGEVAAKWKSFDVGGGSSFNTVAELARQNGANLSAIAKQHKGAASTQFRELTEDEKEAIPPALFRPWVVKDLTAIKHPEFVYSDFYARGYTSVTIAPPKAGKSMLGLAESIDMATGRGFLTGVSRDPLKVVYYNAEDDENVIDARVSALLTEYRIDQSEIAGRLFPTSGVDRPDFFMVSGQEGVVNEALFVSIEKFIQETGADVLIFDPLQDLSRSPETNEVFRMLGQRLRRMASSCGVALGLIHHTRKIAPGMQATIDDARGGSALRGTARFNRILSPMSEDEGAKAGVENHKFYFRIADVESNLAPPSADINRWFEKVSVETPNGHRVGAIKPWKWPDAFDGITRNDAAKVRTEVARMAEPPRADIRSSAWIGVTVADCLGFDLAEPADKNKVKSIVQKWIETDVLRVEESHDARNGRAVKVIVAGHNNPLSEAEA